MVVDRLPDGPRRAAPGPAELIGGRNWGAPTAGSGSHTSLSPNWPTCAASPAICVWRALDISLRAGHHNLCAASAASTRCRCFIRARRCTSTPSAEAKFDVSN